MFQIESDTFEDTSDNHDLKGSESALGILQKCGITERLNRKGVNEVAINRPYEIWTQNSDEVWEKENLPTLTLLLCKQLAKIIGAYDKKDLNNKNPIKTIELPTGQRCQVVIPPAVERDTISMTFRNPSLDRFTLSGYVDTGRFAHAKAITSTKNQIEPWQAELKELNAAGAYEQFFQKTVDRKLNIIIFGGTGSGKTTFAKAVVDMYPRNRRMLTIEAINELKLPYHDNHVHMLYGDHVTPKDCVSSAMRMKGDHIFLAELTGDEAWDFMELLNTGHPGTITTAHANSSLEGFARIAGLIKQSSVGAGLDYSYIDRRVRSSFDVVIYMEHTRILEISYTPEVKLALLNGESLEDAMKLIKAD